MNSRAFSLFIAVDVPAAKHGSATAENIETSSLFLHQGNTFASQGVPDPSSDVRDPRAAPTRDLFLVRDIIRQLESDDQGVLDQATKDVRDPIEATRSIPARVPFVSR
ncbi:hypothetical protein F2Q69_00003408 [Brassica cretica]|uniref:Uncharacterized protein n=1 Tax=Brassica cretica TaxID=69181 RepID=A0A8S9P6X0_BRACR|nr:hypothetical protein F2Q69_00003408 [Brassica cretica]